MGRASQPTETLPTRIRALRLDAGLTLRQLAAHLEVSGEQMRRLETGECQINLEQLKRVARALGVPVAALIRETAA